MKRKILQIIAVLGILSTASIDASQAQYATSFTVTDLDNSALSQKINKGVSALLTEFNSAFFGNRVPSLNKIAELKKDGRSAILSMWEMTPLRCIETEIIERGLRTPTGYQVRNIPMFLKDVPDDEASREIAINFDRQGNIEDIYFTLDMTDYDKIMKGEGEKVTNLRYREAILNFVENFRTAYNRKDSVMLEKIYSDDALIITGKVTNISAGNSVSKVMEQNGVEKQKIEYQVKTKKEYIASLKKNFRINARINLTFEHIEVVQHPKFDSIYGVTLKQYWNASNYSDVGWLFLMIDFQDGENMKVHVRTWQPDKINGRQMREDEVFSLGQFEVRN